MHSRSSPCTTLLLGFIVCGCATKPPPKVAAKVEAAPPAPRVEKMREPLEVTPLELFFSGRRGASKSSESIAVKNTGSDMVQVSDLRVVGTHAKTFRIVDAPLLPAVLRAGASLTFSVGFEPPADAEPGVHRARVRIVRTEDDDGPPCDLAALVAKGKEQADEPPLQQILEALGYAVDVGSPALTLPRGAVLAGDEVKSPLFARAKPGNVGYYLVARYTSDEDSSFGYYVVADGKPIAKGIGSADRGHHQTLNPEMKGDSQTSFDPGESAFGLYLKIGKRTLYSDDRLNPAIERHVARVFPLRSRGRTLVQDAYVVAFDEDNDRDFQDHVFMLWNVKPAP